MMPGFFQSIGPSYFLLQFTSVRADRETHDHAYRFGLRNKRALVIVAAATTERKYAPTRIEEDLSTNGRTRNLGEVRMRSLDPPEASGGMPWWQAETLGKSTPSFRLFWINLEERFSFFLFLAFALQALGGVAATVDMGHNRQSGSLMFVTTLQTHRRADLATETAAQ